MAKDMNEDLLLPFQRLDVYKAAKELARRPNPPLGGRRR
jgi:hypothetical protein